LEHTLSGIRNQVLDDKLDDTSFDPAVVDRFINATQRDIFNTYQLPFTEKVFSGALPVGNYIFQMPTDLQSVLSIVITAPDGQQRSINNRFMAYKDFNASYPTPLNNEAGPITAWTLFGGKMYSNTTIDQSYQMDTFYIKKPITLTDDADVPEIPEEFQEVLVLGAYKRVLERNEDYDMAAVIGNQYNDQLDKLVGRYGFRISSGPVIMKQPNRRAFHRTRSTSSRTY
jgi:hypothetical protein